MHGLSCLLCLVLFINIGFSGSTTWCIWKTSTQWSDIIKIQDVTFNLKQSWKFQREVAISVLILVKMGESDIPAAEVGWKHLSLPGQECHLFLGTYFRERKGQNYGWGFWNWSINSLFLHLSGSEKLHLVLASGSSMYGRSALLQLVAWVVATSCSWLPSGPGCWWLPCRQASDARDWYWLQRWRLKDQQSRKLSSEWSPWKWTLQENWISLWKVCLLALLK